MHQQHQQPQRCTTIERVLGSVVYMGALVLAATLVGGGAASPAYAAPQRQAAAHSLSLAAFGVPHEIRKTIINETSIDGPAFWTGGAPAFAPPAYFLAWTGTDAAHHVNYIAPGISGKVTMPETSIAHPAVVSGGNINSIIAWTGTDSLHRLNLRCVHGCDASLPKLTLPQTSTMGPALLRASGAGEGTSLLLAWTGTDANHSLNVLPLGIAGSQGQEHWVVGRKVTLRQFSSIAGPGLAGLDNVVVLDFDLPSGRIGFATSSDGGQNWTMPFTSPLPELSMATPNMAGLSIAPHDWLTWTGTDSLHHVNVQYTTTFPNWPSAGAKAVLHETALGGPTMGCEATSANPNTCQFVVAWTGTDAAHHLNMAVIGA